MLLSCLSSEPLIEAVLKDLKAYSPPSKNSYQKKFCNTLPLDKLLPKNCLLYLPQDYFPNYYRNEEVLLLSPEPQKFYYPLLKKLRSYANSHSLDHRFTGKKIREGFCIESLRPGRIFPELKIFLLQPHQVKSWSFEGKAKLLSDRCLSKEFFEKLIERGTCHPSGQYVACQEDDLYLRVLQSWNKPHSQAYKLTRAKVQKMASLNFLYEKSIFPKKDLENYLKPQQKKNEARAYLLLWPSAVKKLAEVLPFLQEYGGFRVKSLANYSFKNLSALLKGVYHKENCPLIVQKKLGYLKGYEPSCVLVEMAHPFLSQIAMQKQLKEMKEVLRQRFNPRNKKGIANKQHIVHSLDSEKELKKILPHLILRPFI